MSSAGANKKEGELVGELDNAIKSGDVNAVKAILSDPAMNVNFDGNGNGTALLRAAFFGNLEIVRLLLHKGAHVNAQDQNGESAMFRAINDKSSSLDMIKLLVKERADPNLPAKDGCTPFMHAARRGYLDIVKEFASINVNVHAVDKYNQTALHMACAAGQLPIVNFLISKGLRVDALNVNGETPFFQAISADHLPVAQSLHRQKSGDVNINLQNKFGWTALHWASCSGNSYAVRWLLASGANQLLTNKDGQRPAQMAEDASIRKLLGEPVGNNSSGGKSGEKVPATIGPSTPTTTVPTVPNVLGKAELMQLEQQLLNAAKSGDLQKVRQLLSSPGINKNFTDAVSETPLMKACRQGHFKVCQALVAAGADINARDNYGDSAILIAADKSSTDTVKLLISHGASIHDKNNKNQNVLFRAAYGGNFETVKYLVEQGADVKLKATDNETSLFQSATFGRMNIVKLLVEKGVDLNACTGYYTALHCAGYMSMTETIEYLIAQGADWTIRDNQHRTAVDRAENDRTREAFARAIKLKQGNSAVPSVPVDTQTVPPSAPPVKDTTSHLGTTATPPLPPTSGSTPVKSVAGEGAGTERVVDPIALLTDKLYEAAGGGDVEQVKLLLSTPGLRIDQRIQNSETALIQACYVGHLEVVRLLVEVGGADLNLQDQDGWTALHWAAYNGFVPIVVFLLSKGANMTIESKKGSTALQSTSNQTVKDALSAHGTGRQSQGGPNTPSSLPSPPPTPVEAVDISPITGLSEVELNNLLCTSAGAGDVSTVRRLLHTPGTNIDFKYQNSETALIQACYEGHLPVAQLLVEKGANLNLRDGDGWTALHWAAYNGNAELVKLLLHKGADTTILSKKGATAQESAKKEDIKAMFTAVV